MAAAHHKATEEVTNKMLDDHRIIVGFSVGALHSEQAAWQALQELDQAYSFAPWPAEAWAKLSDHYYLVAAKQQQTWVGLALLQLGMDHDGHLINLTIHPQWRRQGLAKALLQYLQGMAAIDSIYLEVAECNTPARELYRKMGFQELCRKKAFYRDGSAAYAMQWQRGNA